MARFNVKCLDEFDKDLSGILKAAKSRSSYEACQHLARKIIEKHSGYPGPKAIFRPPNEPIGEWQPPSNADGTIDWGQVQSVGRNIWLDQLIEAGLSEREAHELESLTNVFASLAVDRPTGAERREVWRSLPQVSSDYLDARRSHHKGRSGKLGAMPADDVIQLQETLAWAKDELKGKQLRVIELLVENDGEMPLKDLAASPGVSWACPFDEAWNSLQKVVNRKLLGARIPSRLSRKSNNAKLKLLRKK